MTINKKNFVFFFRMADLPSKNGQMILATGGYDHTIKLWQAYSGMCTRTLQHADSVSFCVLLLEETILMCQIIKYCFFCKISDVVIAKLTNSCVMNNDINSIDCPVMAEVEVADLT